MEKENRKRMQHFKKIYKKISGFFSQKKITWIGIVLFLLLMLPVCYLSFVNRASGDDYGYGVYTREAWLTTHSLLQVVKAAVQTIKMYYYSWQGTWFSIFMFSLQPEVFHEGAYIITAFLMLFLWIGSTALLFRQILCKKLHFNQWSFCLVTVIFMTVCIQLIPSTKSAIFWFNGAAHYMVPFTMCQLLVMLLLRYTERYKPRFFIGTLLLAVLLGGTNYQAALFALIVICYTGIADYIEKKDKRIFGLLIPLVLEVSGLIISMKAPGNKVRGGQAFGFSIRNGIETIGKSFEEGIILILHYVREKPLMLVGLLFLFLVLIEAFKQAKETVHFKHPALSILALFCLYSAMQAPAIYAGVEVSGGVHNMNYQVFLLTATGALLIISAAVAGKLKITTESLHDKLVFPGILLCLLLVLLCRSDLKNSTAWVCMEYITSGQADDYKKQMDQQTELLLDQNTTEVVLPFINDVQGPLMHMPVTEDEDAWTNKVTKEFYGKDRVIAIPRPEWEEKYNMH